MTHVITVRASLSRCVAQFCRQYCSLGIMPSLSAFYSSTQPQLHEVIHQRWERAVCVYCKAAAQIQKSITAWHSEKHPRAGKSNATEHRFPGRQWSSSIILVFRRNKNSQNGGLFKGSETLPLHLKHIHADYRIPILDASAFEAEGRESWGHPTRRGFPWRRPRAVKPCRRTIIFKHKARWGWT